MFVFHVFIYLWLMRHGWSRRVHLVRNGSVLFALSEVVERKGRSQGLDRLHLVLDPCNDKRFNSAGCKTNIIIQGSKIWYVITAFFPFMFPESCWILSCALAGNGFSFLFLWPRTSPAWELHKVVRRVFRGWLFIQEAGMKSGLGMDASMAFHCKFLISHFLEVA